MKLVKFFILTLFLQVSGVFAQALDEYKYVIVPAKFDFLKQENQYQLNALTKFLFEKEGFVTVYNNGELPAELANNNCLGLNANVVNESSLFTTKLIVELTNCKNQKVLISDEGKSKEKDYKTAYHEALRNAFESVTEQNYSFTGPTNTAANVTKKPDEVVEIEEIEEVVEEPKTVEEIEEVVAKPAGYKKEAITETVTESEEDIVNGELAKSPYRPLPDAVSDKKLYAQENPLGYQLVDKTPKVVFVLLRSSKDNIYYLKNRTGIFFKDGEQWFAEYYLDGRLVKQEFEVKW